MIDKNRLLEFKVKEFIMNSVEYDIHYFNDKLNTFLKLYKEKDYMGAKYQIDEMRVSALNLFKAISLFSDYALFDTCISLDNKTPEQYQQQIITLIVDNCVDAIKNNLDIFNEPFKPDYYYLNRKYIDERELEGNMVNILFYRKCIFSYITEAKGLCDRHLLQVMSEDLKGNGII